MSESLQSYRAEAILADGQPVIIRAVRPDDKPFFQEGLKRLSKDSQYKRFFTLKHTFSTQELKYLTEIDFKTHVAIGVGIESEDLVTPLGVGRFIVENPKENPTQAEIALTVDDAYHKLGVGSILLRHLAIAAKKCGVTTFQASILGENRAVVQLIERNGFSLSASTHKGISTIRFEIDKLR